MSQRITGIGVDLMLAANGPWASSPQFFTPQGSLIMVLVCTDPMEMDGVESKGLEAA